MSGEEVEELEKELEKRKELIAELTGMVSHDLRNPLNLAKGYLDLAQETGEKEDFEQVKKALNRMESIIEHIIFLSRTAENIEKEKIELDKIFREVWNDLETGDSSFKTEKVSLEADRAGLKTILRYLIENSIEHNQEPVQISLGKVQNGFYFEDDGKGIPENERGKAFEHGFSTEEKSGFGLSAVKRLARSHDWKVKLEESDRGGARFEFKF